jgi:mannose/fructose/N-acetylgalactosamine-specific phosphotransferase system component IIC
MSTVDEIRSAAFLVASAFVFGFGGFTLAFAAEFSGGVFGLALVGTSLVLFYKSQEVQQARPAAEPTPAADGGSWQPQQEGDA